MTDPAAGSGDIQFVFLICSERSGSNLVSAMMGAHSQVSAPPPYHVTRDFIQNLHTMLGQATGSAAWATIKAQLVTAVARNHSKDLAAKLEAWLESSDGAPCSVFRYIYKDLEPDPAAQLVFIKENNLHKVMPFILQCFPDAKFVFQVRDPRDVLASAKARKDIWLGNKFGSNRNALTIWREDQIGGLQTLALLGPDRVHFQRYEDLVSQPRTALTSLCNFLGINFEGALLEFYKATDTETFAKAGSARENLAKPVMASNFGKYRKTLSRGDIKMVEAYLGGLMDRFGYERDFARAADRSTWRMIWQQAIEPLERLMNKEKRPFYTSVQTSFAVKTEAMATPLKSPLDMSNVGTDDE